MMMYLLLRDNKQSGPYSLDELKTLGLKAYDLVWVEGRSAAWRYPSELDELRSFAPAVEEQPFDRFYKKPSPAKSVVATVVASRTGADAENISQVAPPPSPAIYADEPSAVMGKRIIYVTMPAGKSTAVLREGVPVRSTGRIAEENTGLSAYQPAPSRVPVPGSDEMTGLGTDEMTGLRADEKIGSGHDEKLSHVPEDRKNHVEITPHVKRRHSSRIWQPVAVGLSILALLAAGIFIGLSINNDTFRLGKKIAGRNTLPDNAQKVAGQALQLPVAASTSASVIQPSSTDSLLTSTPASSTSQEPVTNAQTAARQHPPRQAPPKEKSAGNSQNQAALATSSKDSASISIPVVHREATHRTDLPADKNDNVDKDVIKNNIANLVSVGTKGYSVGTFGGISALQLTVSNHSVYPLDLVVVEVQYIQANKKVFKTENLYFRGIGPGAALMQEAPKSARGIKVQYKITLVNSKELGLSYSGI